MISPLESSKLYKKIKKKLIKNSFSRAYFFMILRKLLINLHEKAFDELKVFHTTG